MTQKEYEKPVITPIGITDWRDIKQLFGIKDTDRFGHIYSIGKTGVGKSTLLMQMAITDILRGNGLCIIDPHGDITKSILDHIPEHRIKDVIYFNTTDSIRPIGFNPLSGVPITEHHLVASGLISTFRKIWIESWGPRLEYILRYVLLTLLEYPKATLLDIAPLLTDFYFRNAVLAYVTNQHVRAFWKNEFEKYNPALKAEAISPILNKTGIFLTSIPLRNIVGQKESSFTIEQVLNERKILIVNLAKGEIGEDACSILGSILVSAIQLAVMHRSTQEEEDRIPFFLYIDEMHSFVSLSFIDILAEARKYKLSLFLTHQYIDQINEKIRAAIFGNVGTLISFRVGAEDAKYLSKEFSPTFKETDFVALPKYAMYLKLMIDGATSQPFSAQTISLQIHSESNRNLVIDFSREKYGAKPIEIKRQQSEIIDQQTLFG
ncbi:type IV secretory system conjugative DNA transfer family protein [Limnovirga soli]|uniref:Type IV secretion system DNA-binding domain-containing protein n=1 Tax=Limnovirga soli TaxID=2656915 RepID=A0A8J8JSA8_9BACT|nr:type IV secretion system DNA-binding domain-containing protein [Limnovirga soli]NNV53870.1 type IV secretion system DNA-binding domain-containing protein [Limnovirga soli]